MKDLTAENISFTDFKIIGFKREWRPFYLSLSFLMFLLAITANSILIYLITSQTSLHSPMYVLIGLVAIVDLILPIFFVPNMLLNLLFSWSGISLTGCLIQMFCLHFVATFHSTLLLWMALDLHITLQYVNLLIITNTWKSMVVVPLIRNVLLVVTTVSLAGKLSFCLTNVIDHCFCELMALVQLACGDISINNIAGLLTAFLIPTADFILINVSYILIFTSVFKSGKTPMKALNTCISHFIVMSFTLTFALIAFLSYRIRNNFSPNVLTFPELFYPITYGVRTKEIRETFLKFIKLQRY